MEVLAFKFFHKFTCFVEDCMRFFGHSTYGLANNMEPVETITHPCCPLSLSPCSTLQRGLMEGLRVSCPLSRESLWAERGSRGV
jgi:hypothetical protein